MTHVEHVPAGNIVVAHKVDAAAWGLFFIWVGVALIAGLGWGVGLLGIGVIALGAQVVRKALGLGVEGFWIFAGVLFLLGGVWDLLGIRFSLVPLVLIAAGIALFLSAMRKVRA